MSSSRLCSKKIRKKNAIFIFILILQSIQSYPHKMTGPDLARATCVRSDSARQWIYPYPWEGERKKESKNAFCFLLLSLFI